VFGGERCTVAYFLSRDEVVAKVFPVAKSCLKSARVWSWNENNRHPENHGIILFHSALKLSVIFRTSRVESIVIVDSVDAMKTAIAG
jgi:hypothetical protein